MFEQPHTTVIVLFSCWFSGQLVQHENLSEGEFVRWSVYSRQFATVSCRGPIQATNQQN